MSQENVELARRMIDAWDSGDLSEWAKGLHEEVKWVPLAENTQTEPIDGAEATLAFVADWIEPWDEYTIEVLRIDRRRGLGRDQHTSGGEAPDGRRDRH